MKKLLLILLFPLTLFSQKEMTTTTYLEANFGVAFVETLDGLPFPGCSGLIGTTINIEGFLIDVQGGLALPTIITGKVGLGFAISSDNGDINIVAGMRPYPFHLYTQSTLKNTEKGCWIISVELGSNVLSPGFDHWESLGMINFGWRYTINTY